VLGIFCLAMAVVFRVITCDDELIQKIMFRGYFIL
jgi:hypothetical protein